MRGPDPGTPHPGTWPVGADVRLLGQDICCTRKRRGQTNKIHPDNLRVGQLKDCRVEEQSEEGPVLSCGDDSESPEKCS